MAYKWQRGQSQLSGNLIQEGVIEVVDDSGALAVLVDNTGVVSGSALAQFLGVNASNGGITDAGAIDGATTIVASGLANLNGGIEIDDGGNKFTVSNAGVVVAEGLANLDAGIAVDTDKFTVSAAGAVIAKSTLSASGQSSFAAGIDAGAGGAAFVVSSAGALATTALANLNGGIELDNGGNKFTVSTAGEVVAASSISGAAGNFLVVTATAFDAQAGGISNAGSIAGAIDIDGTGDLTMGTITMSGFAVDNDGDIAAKSLAVDDGSTIGPDSVTDLLTFAANGNITVKDGAYNFNIAAHDGTNGLALGGTVVVATATQLDYTTISAIGTADASKAIVLDANKSFAGLKILESDFLTGSTFISGAALALADASGIAGAGLADDGTGKLSVQGNVVSSASLGGILSEGYNYFDTIGTASSAGLPLSPSVGDVVHFKASDLLNKVAVTISASGAHKIEDNQTSVLMESPYGAFSFFYAKANQWLII